MSSNALAFARQERVLRSMALRAATAPLPPAPGRPQPFPNRFFSAALSSIALARSLFSRVFPVFRLSIGGRFSTPNNSREVAHLVDLLIVDRIETEPLLEVPIYGVEDAFDAAERACGGLSGEMIIILGAAGLVCRDRRGKARHHAGHPVPVVSAHGAGDVFVGALEARMATPAQMEDTVAYAQATAGRFVSTPLEERGKSLAAGDGQSRVRRM